MKNKKLEELFLNYMTVLSDNNIEVEMKDSEEMWVLFGEEDFHINKKSNTLYLKVVDILMQNIFNEDYILTGKIDWVAYKKNPITLEHQISVGVDNPFTNNTLTSFVQNQYIVKAIPYQYVRRLQKQNKNKVI